MCVFSNPLMFAPLGYYRVKFQKGALHWTNPPANALSRQRAVTQQNESLTLRKMKHINTSGQNGMLKMGLISLVTILESTGYRIREE